jgi:uncharacterized protein (TIGR02145 family)
MIRGVAALATLLASACIQLPKVPPPTYSTWTGPVTDIDGNVYQTVKIDKMVWMAENLKTTTYNDGTPIPNVTDGPTWDNLSTDAYSWYGNDIVNKDVYGALYNWHAVDTGKLCPTGFFVPSSDTYAALTDFLGGEAVAGGAMKETGTALWQAPNTGATNKSGFSARPAGCRAGAGSFAYLGQTAVWWASDDDLLSYPPTAEVQDASYDSTVSQGFDNPWQYGYSVRCLAE